MRLKKESWLSLTQRTVATVVMLPVFIAYVTYRWIEENTGGT